MESKVQLFTAKDRLTKETHDFYYFIVSNSKRMEGNRGTLAQSSCLYMYLIATPRQEMLTIHEIHEKHKVKFFYLHNLNNLNSSKINCLKEFPKFKKHFGSKWLSSFLF
ncbi:hypothetical protein P8452_21004 [Trifolium repens]|nr:hypothetical protein P8452_21004 [Trifolium repens]